MTLSRGHAAWHPPAMVQAPTFGIATTVTQDSLQPIELALSLEANGFESLFVGEHTHLPVSYTHLTLPTNREV